jgi:hypothetical protein
MKIPIKITIDEDDWAWLEKEYKNKSVLIGALIKKYRHEQNQSGINESELNSILST